MRPLVDIVGENRDVYNGRVRFLYVMILINLSPLLMIFDFPKIVFSVLSIGFLFFNGILYFALRVEMDFVSEITTWNPRRLYYAALVPVFGVIFIAAFLYKRKTIFAGVSVNLQD